MADNNFGAGEPLPQGATINSSTNKTNDSSGGANAGEPLPQGATTTPSGVGSTSNTPTGHHFSLGPSTPGMNLRDMGTGVGQALEGAGEGIFSTVAGAAHLANKIPGVNIPTQTLDTLAGDNEEKTTAEKIGYGGETLTEFMLGDEALKGLSMSDKLLQTAKTMKFLEKSPKTIAALKIGAQALRAGTAQGAQTLVRTGGDVGEAAKQGAIMAGTAGVLGTAGAGIGKVASKLAKGGEAVQSLAEKAANAPEKSDVATGVQTALNVSEGHLHTNYEAGINDLKDRLGGVQTDVKGSPVSTIDEDLLQNPDPSEHKLVTMSKEGYGEKLDKPVKNLLDLAYKGEYPPTEEAMKEAEEATKASLTGTKIEPKTVPLEPWTVDSLIEFRQAVRKQAETYERGNINARSLKQLLPSIDDTIGELAKKSGDADATTDYSNLRADYRGKVGLYDLPVIKNLQDGKVDDAAKEFLSKANQAQYKTESLRTLLGDDEMAKFSHNVFDTMLKGATDRFGHFNPADLMRDWNKVPVETRNTFFQPTASGQDVAALMKDAKTAANIQYLNRAGVLTGFGTIGAATGGFLGHTGMGTLLGLTLGSGIGGFEAGRELIDYVASHPKLWSVYRRAGEAVASQTAGTIGKGVIGTTGQALGGSNQPPNKPHAFQNNSAITDAQGNPIPGTEYQPPSDKAKRTVYAGASGLGQ